MRQETKIKILAFLSVILIPLLLIVDAFQAHRYSKLKSEIEKLEAKQVEIVEQNRKLISDISLLSSSDRIEKIAETELGMHKAKSEDIVRVEIK
ncbi:MAG: cell division protein FtsL [Treponema sp.]|nr:cell division protein FtsL [Treponema sp.]